MSSEYMRRAWIDDGPLYLIRVGGGGENIVKNGDLIALVIAGEIQHPAGVMMVSQEKLDSLTPSVRKALKKLKVEVRAIPVEVHYGKMAPGFPETEPGDRG